MWPPAEKVRLYVDAPLGEGAEISLSRDQSHYVANVMRLGTGKCIGLFNGCDGEWRTQIHAVRKKSVDVRAIEQIRPQQAPADLWLLFAPVKKLRIDMIAEKACEMGVSVLQPVVTDHTNVTRVNVERLRAHAIEAAEQCGLLCVPDVNEPRSLFEALDRMSAARRIVYCDESGRGRNGIAALAELGAGPAAILIGPEGGFSDHEREQLLRRAGVTPVALGPRVLRADTATVAALTLWQAVNGDWRDTEPSS